MILSLVFGVLAICLLLLYLHLREQDEKGQLPSLLGCLGFLLLAFASWGWGGIVVGEGTRSGHIVKLARVGVLYRTWEGELQVGGMDEDGSSRVWDFSVSSEALARELIGAMSAGKRVQVKYTEHFLRCPSLGMTQLDITEVIR